MDEKLKPVLDRYLKPQPLPESMNSQELVRRAVEFDQPPRIPYSFTNPLDSDFFECSLVRYFLESDQVQTSREKGDTYFDEWGVGNKVTGRGWDHSFDHPLQDLTALKTYQFPDIASPARYEPIFPYIEMAEEAGKYVVAYDPLMMFERIRSLMGFEESMIACYTQPEGLEALLDKLADLTIEIINVWAKSGRVDAFMTWEDWGLQDQLQMGIDTFRQFYKPRYQRIIKAAHNNGMHYIWHNCGYIVDMMDDIIELGTDVVQIDQPRLMGHARMAERFGGKICFWICSDIQWGASEEVTDDHLIQDIEEMTTSYNRFDGGLMARQYPQPWDINLSRERQLLIYEAFMNNGCGLD